jgi:hypothetical protein
MSGEDSGFSGARLAGDLLVQGVQLAAGLLAGGSEAPHLASHVRYGIMGHVE